MIKQLDQQISKDSYIYLKLLASRYGIDLDCYQQQAIYNRLAKRLRQLNFNDFESYCQFLRKDIAEEERFINLITNLTTSFFRESHHFGYLKDIALPKLWAAKAKVRIWSACCATGEEPYSIAMVIQETLPIKNQVDVQILATDVNSDALYKAEKGIYKQEQIKDLSFGRQARWFSKDDGDGKFAIKDELKKLVTFNQLNIMDEWPIKGSFDIIFFRNVMIYFKDDVNKEILRGFDRFLQKDGLLIVGHADHLYDMRKHYSIVGKTIYQKNI